MRCHRFLFKIAILSVLCAVGLGKALDDKEQASHDDENQVKIIDSIESDPDEPVFESKSGQTKGHKDKYQNNDDKDYDRDKVIVVRPKPPVYDWTPHCRGQNEIWSTSIKCDIRCDFEGDHDRDHYDYEGYGQYHGYGSSYYRSHGALCYRTVSDFLVEEGHENVTTRETLGYPPEPKEEFEARTLDIEVVQMLRGSLLRNHYHQQDDDHYVVVQQNRPPNRRPPGRCVCRPGYARLNRKCVRFGYCPCKFLIFLDCN